MTNFISKSALDSQKSDKKNTHYVGTIYPQIFENDSKFVFKEDMQMEAGIIWLGGYMINSELFPKKKCPVCGKNEALIPYKTVGSVLSGCHTIKFWCSDCHERFVTNEDIEYFRLIYRYIIKHRHKFTPEQKLKNCTETPDNARLL